MSELIHDLVVTVSTNNVHIQDSYKINSKSEMREVLYAIYHLHPDCNTFKRSYQSLTSEWKTHNRLYRLGIEKDRTKDVDLNYGQKWYVRLFYFIFGL